MSLRQLRCLHARLAIPRARASTPTSSWRPQRATVHAVRRHYSSSLSVVKQGGDADANLNASSTTATASGEMPDEYNESGHAGAVSATYRLPAPFTLESGAVLHDVDVAYTTYGTLNAARDNAIVVCHALTGHSLVHQWWDAMVRPQWTDQYFIICANVLGSCYGSTGPASINPATGQRYGASFPAITVRDAVRVQQQLVQQHLAVNHVRTVIGASMGGLQALEWALLADRGLVASVVAIAANARHSAWQIAFSEVERQAIYMDPLFQDGHYDPAHPPTRGLALARQIAMISYRSHATYEDRYGRSLASTPQGPRTDPRTESAARRHPHFAVQSYLQYQGDKFVSRFDVNSYLALTHLMDTHDVGRGRGGVARALASLQQPALVLGVASDVLYPLAEQRALADHLPRATFQAVETPHGHDGFILEQDAIQVMASDFLDALPRDG